MVERTPHGEDDGLVGGTTTGIGDELDCAFGNLDKLLEAGRRQKEEE